MNGRSFPGHRPEPEVYAVLAELASAGKPGVLATVIRTARSTPRHAGSKMVITADGPLAGSVGGGAAEAAVVAAAAEILAGGPARILELDLDGTLGVCGGAMEVFLEPVLRAAPFLVIGAGHIGQALVRLGAELPFRFTLVDDRPDILEAPSGPGVRKLQAGPGELASQLEVTADGAVLLASRSHLLDGEYLQVLLEAERSAGVRFGFLGGVASRAKAKTMLDRFAGDPDLAARCNDLQLPVGLDIGAETPAEIALGILAEVMAVLRGRPQLRDDQECPVGVRLHRRRDA